MIYEIKRQDCVIRNEHHITHNLTFGATYELAISIDGGASCEIKTLVYGGIIADTTYLLCFYDENGKVELVNNEHIIDIDGEHTT